VLVYSRTASRVRFDTICSECAAEKGEHIHMRYNKDRTLLPPYLWMGDLGHLVGPFKNREVAEFFIENILSPQDAQPKTQIIRENNAWFIDSRETPYSRMTEVLAL
jgi:hypothetical protein